MQDDCTVCGVRLGAKMMPPPPFYLEAWENKTFCSYTCGAAWLVITEDPNQLKIASRWLEKEAPDGELDTVLVEHRIRVYRSLASHTEYTMYDMNGVKTIGRVYNGNWAEEILKFSYNGHLVIDSNTKWIVIHAGQKSGRSINQIATGLTGIPCFGAVRMIQRR